MSTTLLFAPAVETDVADAALWYESQRAGLGLELVQALDDTFEKIRLTPNGVAHMSRRPGYWRDR